MTRAKSSAERRDVDGILILDKPGGMSSNQALQRVKKTLGASKAGHCGSLDPLATGVLPICLGQATRFSGYLLEADKTYLAKCRLGQTTSTADAEGKLIRTSEVSIDRAQLESCLQRFRGDIEQVPPMYSALKHEGKRLYQLARAGEEVERKPRAVSIYRLELLTFDNTEFEIEVSCSKGTYIRSLAQDIGETLGCGAHLIALRRSEAMPFGLQDSITLERLQQRVDQDDLASVLLPVKTALQQFPEFELNTRDSDRICQGKVLTLDTDVAVGLYRLVRQDGRLIGLGEAFSDGQMKAKRLMNTAR